VPAYHYQALDARGNTVSGVIDGDADRQVRASLRERGLTPLEVEPVAERRRGPLLQWSWRPGIRSADLAILTRQFATLVQAGLTIEESLSAVIDQSESARVRAVMAGVRAQVMEGQSLANALSAFPAAFPELYRRMVDAGEQSGRLSEVLERLAEFTENREALKQKVVLAFIYPALVVVVAMLAVTGLMIYVVPQVTRVFINTGQALPLPTLILIHLSAFLRHFGIYLLALLAAAGVGFRLMLRKEEFRYRWHRFLLRVPLLGRTLRGVNAARVASTLGILTSSGIPLLNALQAAVDIPGVLPMRAAIEAAVREVRDGGSLSRALGRSAVFPPMIVHLIASGEATGRLDAMLTRAAEIQSAELENRVRAMTAILEPVLLLVTGGIILFIVLAILLPIFEMNQLIK
jgi:general secretion pathway protein F